MKVNLIHQIPPCENNPRNSEGAFLRGKRGEILFAYSRYTGTSCHDHATCDIAMITSHDEGRSWSEPRIIAHAADFGTANIMSVSAMEQKNGDLAFYFLIKENDFSTTIGRVVGQDADSLRPERCGGAYPAAYYVINNDRFVRLSDGRIVAPAAYITKDQNRHHTEHRKDSFPYVTSCLVSEDDGKSFYKANFDLCSNDPVNRKRGFQEPGLIEYPGILYLWMRTGYGRQYESISATGTDGFFAPRPSVFTSPDSPMQIKTFDGVTYAVYNPIPLYDGRSCPEGVWGRTPFVIRKSLDNGVTFGTLNVIEADEDRGYCYPAMFKTNDNRLLLAYCRGSAEDGNTLCRLGISEIDLDTIE